MNSAYLVLVVVPYGEQSQLLGRFALHEVNALLHGKKEESFSDVVRYIDGYYEVDSSMHR